MSPFDSSRLSAGLRGVLVAEDYPLLAAVVLLPWAFGGVEIWAYRSAAFLLVISAALALVRHGWSGLGLDRGSRWLLPAFLLVVWAVIQLVPLPASVVGLLSPRANAVYEATVPGYPGRAAEPLAGAIEERALSHVPESRGLPEPRRNAEAFVGDPGGRWSGWRPLSLLPSAGVERIFWYCALLLGFLVARARCRDRDLAAAYRRVLFGSFFALAVFGLLYAATSNGRIYWMRTTLESTRPFGPYVNPTNFGAVMELATPWLAGMTLWTWRQRSPSVSLGKTKVPLLAAVTLLCLLAGLATASKAAAVLIGSSLLVLALFAIRNWRGLALLAGLAATIVVLSVLVLPRSALGHRVQEFVDSTGTDVSRVDRVVAWYAALDMLGDYAVTGSGFGSFSDVFPFYTPAGDYKRWYQVHNDYLEVVLEGGLVAAVLVAWLAFNYWRRVVSGLRGRRRDARDYAALGLALGLLSLSVHALFDFNHQIPGNALLFVASAAMALGLSEGSPAREVGR